MLKSKLVEHINSPMSASIGTYDLNCFPAIAAISEKENAFKSNGALIFKVVCAQDKSH